MQHDFQHTSGRPSRKDSSGNNCKGIAAFMVCHQEVHCMKSQSHNFIVSTCRIMCFLLTLHQTQCQINGLAVPWTTLRCTISSFRTEMGYTVWRKIRDIIAASLMEKQTENYRKYTIYIVTLPSGAFSTNRLLLFMYMENISTKIRVIVEQSLTRFMFL